MNVLISVSDKTGIVEFAQQLSEFGAKIISTGGTLNALKKAGIPAIPIDDLTGFPEMLDGRVKTLHPKVHGGLLARRDKPAHMEQCKVHNIHMIDMVVVNLYPFEATISKPGVSKEEAIENIDIGGPSMLRSASKNFASVAVVVDPKSYPEIIHEMKQNMGKLLDQTRAKLAGQAFAHTAKYDAMIAAYFEAQINQNTSDTTYPETVTQKIEKVTDLRYGENPHQSAAFYRLIGQSGIADYTQLHGKELSYNNIVDMEAAWQIVASFDVPAAVVVKHTNPCGAAIGSSISEAYAKAYKADPVSAFGGIIGLNRAVDAETAAAISEIFVEVVIAPEFEENARLILSQKPSVRLITLKHFHPQGNKTQYKHVQGGFLLQSQDNHQLGKENLSIATQTPPSQAELSDLVFAFNIVKFVKSNAIVIAKDGVAVGVGAGQMSRVESTEIAINRAGKNARGAVLASDAFFPFKDSVELALDAGIKAFIHPGGSKRDQESIDAANEKGASMIITGIRHFKH